MVMLILAVSLGSFVGLLILAGTQRTHSQVVRPIKSVKPVNDVSDLENVITNVRWPINF